MNYYLAIDQAIKYIQAYETIENKLKEIENNEQIYRNS